MVTKCCGTSNSSTTQVNAGDGIRITGSGTPTNPFVIESDLPDFASSIKVRDTETVNMTLTGSGNVGDPFEIRAESTLRLSQLTDVNDPQGGPSIGESPVWVGTGAAGHWEFGTLPPAPAGAVNVTNGVTGVGSVELPIGVATSGVWGAGSLAGLGTDSTVGLATYIDSAGKLRAKPVGSISWASIPDKPTSFPPSQHGHNASDIPLAQQALLNVGKVNGRTIVSTANSSTPPANPAALDLWFFPKGT